MHLEISLYFFDSFRFARNFSVYTTSYKRDVFINNDTLVDYFLLTGVKEKTHKK